ncbi:MAG: hypothetical protein JXB10_10340 [Pirellulales bacterium]|nr:hypothetical protein [Pirellulales bacterium]
MAERMAAEIHVGGKMTTELAEELCGFVCAAGVQPEYGGGRFEPQNPEELLQAKDGDYLRFYDDEASWGEFADLEEFLQGHGIPFDRYSDGKYEYDCELKWFRPGIGVSFCITTKAGLPVVEAVSIKPVLRALQRLPGEFKKKGLSMAGLWKRIERIEKLLRRKLPDEMPRLPPFRILSRKGSGRIRKTSKSRNPKDNSP